MKNYAAGTAITTIAFVPRALVPTTPWFKGRAVPMGGTLGGSFEPTGITTDLRLRTWTSMV